MAPSSIIASRGGDGSGGGLGIPPLLPFSSTGTAGMALNPGGSLCSCMARTKAIMVVNSTGWLGLSVTAGGPCSRVRGDTGMCSIGGRNFWGSPRAGRIEGGGGGIAGMLANEPG